MLSNILIFVMLSLSVGYMWSFSDIFAPIRKIVTRIPYIRKPLLCPNCASYWVGLVVSFMYNPLDPILPYIISNIWAGLITHLFANGLYKHINK